MVPGESVSQAPKVEMKKGKERQCTSPQTIPFPLQPFRLQHAAYFAVSLASPQVQTDPLRTTTVGVGLENDTVGHLPFPVVIAEACVEDGTTVVGGEVAVPISATGIVFTKMLCPGLNS